MKVLAVIFFILMSQFIVPLAFAGRVIAQISEETGGEVVERVSAPELPPSEEADMELIRERMMILAGNLGGIPEPPKMDKKIKIPNVNLGSNKKH